MSASKTSRPASPPANTTLITDDSYKWKAFAAIAVSFFTMVMSVSAVYVALEAIADDFGITLRAVTWVVIAQALTISAFMMPMGRLADIIGRKKVHLIGLVLFACGAVLCAVSPVFVMLIGARVIMAAGNSMSQSVGTAMVISVFPPEERGKAIGSQTTAVAVGGAVGPVIAGLTLQFLPWQALFWMLVPPIVIGFIAAYFILDEDIVSQRTTGAKPRFDLIGAVLSSVAIICAVILINNPLAESWFSPLMIGGVVAVVAMMGTFVAWELHNPAPMLQLRMFRNTVFSMAVATRFVGFLGTTAVRFLLPIFLISLRGLSAGAAGGVLFLTSLGMGISAQVAGQLSDRFGERPFTVAGFVILVVTALGFAFTTNETPMWALMIIVFVNGVAMGLWNVPNNSTIMGSVPSSSFGVVGAFTNLTRNVGNVTGQAIASAVVVGVMAARGFDVPLSEIKDTAGAGDAFIDGWRLAFLCVTAFSATGMLLSAFTKPKYATEAG